MNSHNTPLHFATPTKILQTIFNGSQPATRAQIIDFIEKDTQLNILFNQLKAIEHPDASHDIDHFIRVARWARFIIAKESKASNLNQEIKKVLAASLLHDIVNVPKNHPDRNKASELSSKKAYTAFKDAGFTEEDAIDMQNAVRTHSFSRGEAPVSFLGKALQDADRLDAIGALGIIRCFHVSGQVGSRLFDPDDIWARNRPLNDKIFATDHFFTKLLHLNEGMHTNTAKMEAQRRKEMMHNFLAELGDTEGDNYN